jgi:hypothetical protein
MKIKCNWLYLFSFAHFLDEKMKVYHKSLVFYFSGCQIVEDVEDFKLNDVFCLC